MKIASLLLPLLCLANISSGAPLRTIPWDDEIAARKFYVAYGDKKQEVGYLHPSARSEPIKISLQAEDLRLLADEVNDAEGNPIAQAIKVPLGTKSPLLLLVPDEKSPLGVRSIVLEDDPLSFSWGSTRLFNLTSKPILFRWDKKSKPLKPGWSPTDVSPGGSNRNMEVFLYLKSNPKKPFYSSIWEHREDQRLLAFVIPSEDATLGLVKFKFIPETRVSR